jgi:hypothetical protein
MLAHPVCDLIWSDHNTNHATNEMAACTPYKHHQEIHSFLQAHEVLFSPTKQQELMHLLRAKKRSHLRITLSATLAGERHNSVRNTLCVSQRKQHPAKHDWRSAHNQTHCTACFGLVDQF